MDKIKKMSDIFGIVIHGGAGTILKASMTAEKEAKYREKLAESINTGYEILESGGSSLDAVEKAVNVMEDSPLFNAGKGAVFTHDGKNEQDASLMDGKTLQCGAVAGVRHIKNPISLARLVMEKSEHVLLISDGAEAFAQTQGVTLVDEDYFYTDQRWKQLQLSIKREKQSHTDVTALDHTPDEKHGTVGAVAVDKAGNLAAATSSGGMTNKKFGRVGDSPLIGAGNYANDKTCAVSTTGYGEYFIRLVTAYDVAALMEYRKLSLKEAADLVIYEKLTQLGGSGGLIAIDGWGNITMPFNSEGMYRGFMLSNGKKEIKIFKD